MEKEMDKFEMKLTAHSTPALPSHGEGREFCPKLDMQSRDESFVVKPENFSSYAGEVGDRGELGKFEDMSSIIFLINFMRMFGCDGFGINLRYFVIIFRILRGMSPSPTHGMRGGGWKGEFPNMLF